MSELTLYSGDAEIDEIKAELSAGYDVMYNTLSEQYESEEQLKEDLSRLIEQLIFAEIQQQADGEELHMTFAQLTKSLEETGEVDMDSLTTNSIHQLTQVENQ